MIDAKDIMVGNWFEHNANWCFRSPEDLKPFLFQWEERDWYALGECTMSLDDVSPIPLSPDILEKCGFENVYENKWANDLVEIQHYELGDWYELLNGEERTNWTHQVKYVHQLQNLYYSLTNQELNIHL